MKHTPKNAVFELNYGELRFFIGASQRLAMTEIIFGEEGQDMVEKVFELKAVVQTMAKSYETDSQGQAAIAKLHYFRGAIDAWITERDAGESGDGEFAIQHQAFGKITLTGQKSDAELGYISIYELIRNGLELDLHWTPITLGEIK